MIQLVLRIYVNCVYQPAKITPILQLKLQLMANRQSQSRVTDFDLVDFVSVAYYIEGRSREQCAQRWDQLHPRSIMKGKWTKDEDIVIIIILLRLFTLQYFKSIGHWCALPAALYLRQSLCYSLLNGSYYCSSANVTVHISLYDFPSTVLYHRIPHIFVNFSVIHIAITPLKNF